MGIENITHHSIEGASDDFGCFVLDRDQAFDNCDGASAFVAIGQGPDGCKPDISCIGESWNGNCIIELSHSL